MLRFALFPFCLLLLVISGATRAATIAVFDVAVTGEIAGIAAGTVNGDATDDPGGYGLGGTATLDDAGVLTLLHRNNAVTSFTNTIQDVETIFAGSLGGSMLSGPAGQFRALACSENGGSVEGCPFVSSNGAFPSPPTPLSNLPATIVLDLSPGGTTTFTAQAIIPNTTTTFTYRLTALPEPGAGILVALGLVILARPRADRAPRG